MEASSHLVLDNCLLRPIPLISHVNLHWRLVCLGSKLTNMRMVGKGKWPCARELHLLPRAPVWHWTLKHTPVAATTLSPATELKLPCKNKARNPHPTLYTVTGHPGPHPCSSCPHAQWPWQVLTCTAKMAATGLWSLTVYSMWLQ